MNKIIVADVVRYSSEIREIFIEYLNWGAEILNRDYGTNFSVPEILEDDMATLYKFAPPQGRLILSLEDDYPSGIACLKHLTGNIGEIKRMYVRPIFRGKGIGRSLLQRLIEEAQTIGYEKLKLDSARFMAEAHSLYQSMGFVEIDPYEGSEIPKPYQKHWKFMEKTLKIIV